MLHSIFKRAVRDQLIVTNPCEHTELPKIIARRSRTLTPTEYDLLMHAIPDRHRLLVETAIETGMRWGELIALRPRHIDFLRTGDVRWSAAARWWRSHGCTRGHDRAAR
jgi:integrase